MTESINYPRLYEYRFHGIDQTTRQAVWNEIGPFIYARLGSPMRVLDPCAGRCEFLNAVDRPERWSVDQVDNTEFRAPGITSVTADIFAADLPIDFFDGVFVSNFLEHLFTQEDVARFLAKMVTVMQSGGRIAILGPNFRYCSKEYFDCADHTLALTHLAVAEHLYAAGFTVDEVIPRFLPFSFRGALKPSPALTRWYLKMRPAWRILGKQFLILASKP